MKTLWSEKRLQRLFDRYNKKLWENQLVAWTVDTNENHPGAYGYCNPRTKRISVLLATHRTDREVRATLVHEMAHAATNTGHGRVWREEMGRLKSAGAPTSPLDFLVPYGARGIVTSFMEAAYEGASWEEALANLGEDSGLTSIGERPLNQEASRLLRKCKKYFQMARIQSSRR